MPRNLPPPFLKQVRLPRPNPAPQTYPFTLPLFAGGLTLDFTNPITIIVGENGSGKSSLLEAIATKVGFNRSGGKHYEVMDETGSLNTGIDTLADQLTLSWLPKINRGFFFRAESFFTFANYIDALSADSSIGGMALVPYGGKSLHDRSHGEAFTALFQSRSSGLFILDEPEAALSPQRQVTFLAHLHTLLTANRAQIIMATHSPILMAYPGAQFLHLEDGILTPADYRTTAHYKTYRRFLEHPDAYLQEIFTADSPS